MSSCATNKSARAIKRGTDAPTKFHSFDCAGNVMTSGTHTIAVYYVSATCADGTRPMCGPQAPATETSSVNADISLCFEVTLKMSTCSQYGIYCTWDGYAL